MLSTIDDWAVNLRTGLAISMPVPYEMLLIKYIFDIDGELLGCNGRSKPMNCSGLPRSSTPRLLLIFSFISSMDDSCLANRKDH